MTNVPQIIRDLWTDLYKLFDRNYLLPNTEEAWGKFWEEARQIDEKYHGCPYLPKAFDLVTAMSEARIKAEERQETYRKADEKYPAPEIQQSMGLF